MSFYRAKPLAPRPIPLSRLAASDATLLKRASKGEPMTLSNLDLWIARSAGDEQYELQRIYESLYHPAFAADDMVLFDGKMQPMVAGVGLGVQARSGVDGELPQIAAMREAMVDGLWGQSQSLEAFVAFRASGLNTTFKNPSVLAISGDVGHGKAQALAQFTRELTKPADEATKKPEIQPVRIDLNLTTAKDSTVGSIFAGEGPLSPDSLAKLAESGADALVHVRNMPSNTPALAAAFNTLFADESPVAKQLYFALDFDGPVDPHATVLQAFGRPGARALSAETRFGPLDGPTMLRYFDQRLPQLMAASRLERQTPVLSKPAREALGKALATPFEPLDELDARIDKLVLKPVATQTSYDPEVSVLRYELAPALRDPKKKGALTNVLSELHQPGAKLLGVELLRPVVTARKPDLNKTQTTILTEDVLAHTNGLEELAPELLTEQRAIATSVQKLLTQVQAAETFGWHERVTTDTQYLAFTRALEGYEGALYELMQARSEAGVRVIDPGLIAVRDAALSLQRLHQSMATLAQRPIDVISGEVVIDAIKSLGEPQ